MEVIWDLFDDDCVNRKWGDEACMSCKNLWFCHEDPEDSYDEETNYSYKISDFSRPEETFKPCVKYRNFTVGRFNRNMIGYGLSDKNDRYYSLSKNYEQIVPDTFTYNGVDYCITGIGEDGFFHCNELKVVSLPHTVKEIGFYAFNECLDLEAIYMGKGLKEMKCPFIQCYNLRKIKVHKDNPYFCDVDGVMFNKDMTVLVRYPSDKLGETYVVPDGVREISAYAFYGSKNLKSIKLPNTVVSIGEGAFWYSKKLETVNIPNGVTVLNDNLFIACESLKRINIPDSVERIGKSVFWGCKKLKSIVIPDTVSYIDEFAFISCLNLKTVTLSNNLNFLSKGLFNDCSKLVEIKLPNRLIEINQMAFSGCKSLEFLSLPNTVLYIGTDAFYLCSKLKIEYKGSVDNWGRVMKCENWDRVNNSKTIEVEFTDRKDDLF